MGFAVTRAVFGPLSPSQPGIRTADRSTQPTEEGAMAVFSVQQIKYEFLLYMKGLGGAFGDWYVGAAADAEAALFSTHGVQRNDDPWIYKPALTNRATITIVRYFVEVLHTDGRVPDLTDDGATIAFLFRKSASTHPSGEARSSVVLPKDAWIAAAEAAGR